VAVAVAVLVVVGCNKKGGPQATSPVLDPAAQANVQGPGGAGAQDLPAGRKIFDSVGCARCHSMGGAPGASGPPQGGPPPGGPPGPGGGPGRGMNRGPDLAHVGKDPAHTAEWISAHIRNPKTHKPDSRMPPFGEDKLNANDLRVLSEYLAGLK
jgi:cbb3-type cytochrome oxidase cytochrome c subunit